MQLFDPLPLRDVTLRNRIAVSPMCEYSSKDGYANSWHLVHLGSRAVGGAGLVMTEAAAVSADGRISPADLGIYLDGHIEKLHEIVSFIHEHGAVAGIQLAHAGFKASTAPPWEGGGPVDDASGGWLPIHAPSRIAFKQGWIVAQPLSHDGIDRVMDQFVAATQRAVQAGFRVIELHAAHGYLIHEFLSPITNHRDDEFGGPFENRIRFLLQLVQRVRRVLPDELPLNVRISASDWTDGGWSIEESIELCRRLKSLGVTLIDVSSGGISPDAKIAVGPGYQVGFARRIRAEAQIKTGAVGMITEPEQANTIIQQGDADLVFLARELLRQPYWPLRAATELGIEIEWPKQYDRAKPR